MTKEKHTPGPWIVREFQNRRKWVVDSTADIDGAFVGQVIHSPTANPADDANMHLIAAAPELYEACKTARSVLYAWLSVVPLTVTGEGQDALNQLEAAIRKAEGNQ